MIPLMGLYKEFPFQIKYKFFSIHITLYIYLYIYFYRFIYKYIYILYIYIFIYIYIYVCVCVYIYIYIKLIYKQTHVVCVASYQRWKSNSDSLAPFREGGGYFPVALCLLHMRHLEQICNVALT